MVATVDHDDLAQRGVEGPEVEAAGLRVRVRGRGAAGPQPVAHGQQRPGPHQLAPHPHQARDQRR